jgi:DNA (cytosine-5)-methyltransferase 1
MRYGSVCSGIEAATAAWHPLGWRPSFFSETDTFPRAVLKAHYPDVSLHGDFTTIQDGEYDPIELLVGGTPCQDFSVAGLRKGFAGDRGNLTFEFVRLAERLHPRWIVWENVPGVLSSGGGRDFGSFLGRLAKLGYGFAYRVLDAQYFHLAQRRKRVFVVGHLGDWRRAAAVLFERESLSGHPAPRRETREGIAHDVAPSLTDSGRGVERTGESFDTTQITSKANRCNPQAGDLCHPLAAGVHAPAIAFNGRMDPVFGDIPGAIDTDGGSQCVAFSAKDHGADAMDDLSPTLRAVRRLTPRECERLQGFPDDYTLIAYRGKPAADGPRYKALGNSMAVPVMRWIGERIAAVGREIP